MSSAQETDVGQQQAHQRAQEREAATRKILDVIAQSRDDERPVFDVILRSAAKLCNAPMARLHLPTEDRTEFELVANWGDGLRTMEIGERWPFELSRQIPQTMIEGRTIHMDMAEHPGYRNRMAPFVQLVEEDGIRTRVTVPLMSKGVGIGCITLSRRDTKPFDKDDITLVETFAAQAVIAIENVRQFRAIQMANSKLATRLAREEATREVLQVISHSRNDETPVFEAILEQAARLCKVPQVGLIMANEDRTSVTYAACWGTPSKHFRPGVSHWSIDSPIAITTAIREGRVVNIADTMDDTATLLRDPDRLEIIEEEQIRSVLAVPLMKDAVAIGCIDVYRREVDPFGDDDIKLLENFAAQAVIAIENVRQFKALAARTEEVQALNASLEARVEEQVGEIQRMGRLKHFLSPAVAEAVVTTGEEMLSSHRALIAVLFCDIRGFTAFCEIAEPEETIEVLQTYHEEMGRLVSEYGGGVDKRMGDGIMVVFNDPLPCDDPAGATVRLALAMRARMRDLCKNWRKVGHRLGFGVGISLGYATVGMVGSEGRYDYTASGTAVNLGARLCDQADDGEILLSLRAATAVEDDFVTEPIGEIDLKGMREPVEVFRLGATVTGT